jgi:uncharacterized protein (DUF2141 family)
MKWLVLVPSLLLGACGTKSDSETMDTKLLVTLKMKVTGLKISNSPTQLCYAVFNSPDGFPADSSKVAKNGCLPLISDSLEFSIEDIPSLRKGFVVSVFQDMDMSNKMETKKFLGFDVPAEPFGFTNNPPLLGGAPTFEKCKINALDGVTYEIKMKTM